MIDALNYSDAGRAALDWVTQHEAQINDPTNGINTQIQNVNSQLNNIIKYQTVSAVSNTYTLDLSKNYNFAIETLDTVAKTIVFSNIPSTVNLDLGITINIKFTNSASITYPASIVWQNGTIPTFTVGKVSKILFETYDNGVTWYGSAIGVW